MTERLYVTPEKFSGKSDTVAIQMAVDAAIREDIRVVQIGAKPGGEAWELDVPVQLPSFVTVILNGAYLKAAGVAFTNSNALKPETRCLAGEQEGIHILGKNGAAILGADGPQVVLANVKNCCLRGLRLAGGAGVRLEHVRYSKIQQLRFENTLYGVSLTEGCNNNLLEDLDASTEYEAVRWVGGSTTIWGRGADMYDSLLFRIRATCRNGAAVLVDGGCVSVYNLFVRDVVDESGCDGVSVVLGGESDVELRDLSVRNVESGRIPVSVNGFCDGIYMAGLRGQMPVVSPDATRVLVEAESPAVQMPVFPEAEDVPFITPNDPRYFGDGDAETIQNAVNAAVEAGVKLVIPRLNVRTQKMRWDVEKTIVLPEGAYVELLDAHLRQVDFTYCNMFTNREGAGHITVSGVGNAVVDTGKNNGLKLKNAGKLGFGPITDNATFLFKNADGLTIKDLHIHQSRWYSIYCVGCTNGWISDINLFAPPIFPDLGGIQLRCGCLDFLVENITGLSGEEMIILGIQQSDEVFAPADKTVCNIHIRNVLANCSRCHLVDILSHDGGCVENVVVESLLDNSLAEQKKQPSATVRIGHAEGYYAERGGMDSIRNITVRDINGRGASTVELGGCSTDVRVTNIHTFGTSENSLRTALPPECSDYLMASISADPSAIQVAGDETPMTRIAGWMVSGIFFRCAQASRYMRGTATSIITDKKKYIGMVLQLDRLETDNLVIRDVFIDRAGQGVRLSGKAAMEITGLQAGELGRTLAVCGSSCNLKINGNTIPVTVLQKI